MSYDLAVWTSPVPLSSRAAAETYEAVMDRLEAAYETEAEPVPPITAFVEALTARWPDLSDDGGEDSPWAVSPLIADAAGDAIAIPMSVTPLLDEAVAFVAAAAEAHRLVCFDPQTERLLAPQHGAHGHARPTS